MNVKEMDTCKWRGMEVNPANGNVIWKTDCSELFACRPGELPDCCRCGREPQLTIMTAEETNEHGARQSRIPGRYDLLPPEAIEQAAIVLKAGEHYGKDNWRRISCEDHINHALRHIFQYLANDQSEPHLGHALVRLMFAVGVRTDLKDQAERV